MKRLSYRYTKDNDEELNKIAKYLADSKPLQAAAEIYSDIEEMKNLMIEGMCHFVGSVSICVSILSPQIL